MKIRQTVLCKYCPYLCHQQPPLLVLVSQLLPARRQQLLLYPPSAPAGLAGQPEEPGQDPGPVPGVRPLDKVEQQPDQVVPRLDLVFINIIFN